MKRWTRFVALTASILLIAGPVWAQSTTTSPSDKSAPGSTGTTGTPGSTGTTGTGTPGTADKPSMGTDATQKGTTGTSMDKMDKDRMKGDKNARGRMAGGGANKDQVKAAQQALKDKGHDPGPVDGMMGPKTRAAVRDFQKKEGIRETGRLDQETMSKLGVEMKTGATGTSSPSASPSVSDTKDAAGSASPSPGASAPSAAPGTTGTTDTPKTNQQGGAGTSSTTDKK